MKSILLGCLTALTFGCASQPQVTDTVNIPTRVDCLTTPYPVRPDYETEKLLPTAKAGAKVVALARDWSRSRTYERELEAALEGCK